jgi:large repetitive protein
MSGKKHISANTTSLVLDGRTGSALPKVVDVPDAPTIGTAAKVGANASVQFTAPVTGGTPTSYTASAYLVSTGLITSPLKSGTGTTSPISVTGLTTGIGYTFKVAAVNTVGSTASASSNPVTM